MSSNVVNQVPYIKTSREFPPDISQLAVIMTRSYIEVANAINLRSIGLFPSNRPSITGDSYFITKNQRQQSLRQTYTFTTTANIDHGIPVTTVSEFVKMYGQFTDGTNWYGTIAGSNVAIAGQLSFYITPTQIVFAVGAGSPTLTKGIIVLEWLSQV